MVDDVRQAVVDDRARLIDTVVEAFKDDPAFNFFFGAGYVEQAPVFTGALFDCRVASGGVWVTESVDAVALWDLPNAAMSSDLSALPADSQRRLDDYHDVVHGLLPPQPFWYLGVLASHPSRRGSGLATIVGREGLRAAAAAGVPAVLETTNPNNVAMYERRGWSIHDSAPLGDFTVWTLTHSGEE